MRSRPPKKIEDGDMVVVDFGVLKDGYCSDMTRTLLFGNVSEEHMRIFQSGAGITG